METDFNDPYVPSQQAEGKRWNRVENGRSVGMECVSPWDRCLALSLPFLKPEGEQGGDCDDVSSLAVSLRAHGFMVEPGMFSFLVLSIFCNLTQVGQ